MRLAMAQQVLKLAYLLCLPGRAGGVWATHSVSCSLAAVVSVPSLRHSRRLPPLETNLHVRLCRVKRHVRARDGRGRLCFVRDSDRRLKRKMLDYFVRKGDFVVSEHSQ